MYKTRSSDMTTNPGTKHVFATYFPRVFRPDPRHVFTMCLQRVRYVFYTCCHVFPSWPTPRVRHVFKTCFPRAHTTFLQRARHVFVVPDAYKGSVLRRFNIRLCAPSEVKDLY